VAGLNRDRGAEVVISTASSAPGAAVISVAGELDASNAHELKTVAASIAATHRDELIFELSDLRYMDSAGIAVLLDACSRVGVVRLRDPSVAVRRVIELAGLTDVLPLER
jgi:anti-sigma B factor antagonist